MSEEYNPYNQNSNGYVREDQPPQYMNRQQPVSQQQYYSQPVNQQPVNQQPVNQQPVNQQYYGQPVNQPVNPQPVGQPQYYYAQNQYARQVPAQGGGIAKAFAIVAFSLGCLSLLIAFIMLIVAVNVGSGYYFRRSVFAGLAGSDLVYSLVLSVPGLVFGIIALVKKTRLFPMGLMGVIFNGILLLQMFIFLMMSA